MTSSPGFGCSKLRKRGKRCSWVSAVHSVSSARYRKWILVDFCSVLYQCSQMQKRDADCSVLCQRSQMTKTDCVWFLLCATLMQPGTEEGCCMISAVNAARYRKQMEMGIDTDNRCCLISALCYVGSAAYRKQMLVEYMQPGNESELHLISALCYINATRCRKWMLIVSCSVIGNRWWLMSVLYGINTTRHWPKWMMVFL